MSAKNEHNRDGVVAVGQVNGCAIQVLQAEQPDGFFYEFRILKADGSIYYPHNLYDTISEAFDAAVMHLIPDAEPIEVEDPTQEDWDALNAALYVGGAQEPIENIGAAVGTFIAMGTGIESLRLGKEKAKTDLETIEDILAGALYMGSPDMENLNKLAEIFQAQSDVLLMILERSREVLAAFITRFIKP